MLLPRHTAAGRSCIIVHLECLHCRRSNSKHGKYLATCCKDAVWSLHYLDDASIFLTGHTLVPADWLPKPKMDALGVRRMTNLNDFRSQCDAVRLQVYLSHTTRLDSVNSTLGQKQDVRLSGKGCCLEYCYNATPGKAGIGVMHYSCVCVSTLQTWHLFSGVLSCPSRHPKQGTAATCGRTNRRRRVAAAAGAVDPWRTMPQNAMTPHNAGLTIDAQVEIDAFISFLF